MEFDLISQVTRGVLNSTSMGHLPLEEKNKDEIAAGLFGTTKPIQPLITGTALECLETRATEFKIECQAAVDLVPTLKIEFEPHKNPENDEVSFAPTLQMEETKEALPTMLKNESSLPKEKKVGIVERTVQLQTCGDCFRMSVLVLLIIILGALLFNVYLSLERRNQKDNRATSIVLINSRDMSLVFLPSRYFI